MHAYSPQRFWKAYETLSQMRSEARALPPQQRVFAFSILASIVQNPLAVPPLDDPGLDALVHRLAAAVRAARAALVEPADAGTVEGTSGDAATDARHLEDLLGSMFVP